MVHITEVSAGFMYLSALIGIGLLAVALRAYSRHRDRAMLFLGAAFAVFTVKAVVVGTSILLDLIEHEVLELVDAVGDLLTIALIVAPLFVSRD